MAILDPQKDVFVRLSSDVALTAQLATYRSAPAVFADYAPTDYQFGPLPAIVVASPSANESDDTYTEDYRQVTLNVRLYHLPQGSSAALELAGEQARLTLKSWASGAMTGGSLTASAVSGPVEAPTQDPALEGRLLQVRLTIKETTL